MNFVILARPKTGTTFLGRVLDCVTKDQFKKIDMDYKDFKKYLQDQVKKTLSNSLSSYSAKLRNSRPRAKDNIINPKQKGI